MHRITVKQKTINTRMNNNMIISGLHLDLTVALKNIVNEKMEKIFKHEEKIIREVEDFKEPLHVKGMYRKQTLQVGGMHSGRTLHMREIYRGQVKGMYKEGHYK